MLAIPENVLARFNEVLKQRAVHESSHVYYRKWLRYFLDFCRKYPPPETKSEQVRLFIEKLKSKKQTPQQCTQAAHAVSLFFELQRPINCPPSAAIEERNLLSARLANPPAKALVTKIAVTGGIGKGDKDRTVPLPQRLIPKLKTQLEEVSKLHDKDLAAGYAGVFLVDSLEKSTPPLPRSSSGNGFSRKMG